MLLIMECRWHGVDRLHNRPCRPLVSNALLLAQVYGEQALVPSLYATAKRISSSDNRSLTDAMGGACNQFPEWGAQGAFSQALSTSDVADASMA